MFFPQKFRQPSSSMFGAAVTSDSLKAEPRTSENPWLPTIAMIVNHVARLETHKSNKKDPFKLNNNYNLLLLRCRIFAVHF